MRTLYFKILLTVLLTIIAGKYAAAQTTGLQGVVKDSLTNEELSFVTITFDNTSIGVFSDEKGRFDIRNRAGRTGVTISFIGYRTKKIELPAGKITNRTILLQPEDLSLGEVVVKPQKEKYSKKNNPAVELIKKVIEHKDSNNVKSADYFQCREYDRILFALNDFKPNQGAFKKMKFLPNYIDTSIIDKRPILPFSVRETTGNYYYRKQPKSEKRYVDAFNRSGIDNEMDIQGLESIINEVFKDISIYDNSITFMMQDFVSPLSSHSSVNFYKWYIMDTIPIENKDYIELAFAPFNSRDLGLTGYLYISTDSTYAVKRAVMRVPHNINMNFVDEMLVWHDFVPNPGKKWLPTTQRVAVDMSMYGMGKIHIDKTRVTENYTFENPVDSIYKQSAPVLYAKDYQEKDKDYWTDVRPLGYKDNRVDDMMDDLRKIPLLNFAVNAGRLFADGYFHTAKDPKKSKIDIGTLLTFYSYNSVEGNRLRGTFSTTPAFNKRLFLYGYGAYGMHDNKMKYYGEATWSFRDVKEHRDEFPRNVLTVGYKYDVNNLGQRYTQAERDNIYMSLHSSNSKSTYNRQSLLSYQHEYYNGLSYKVSGQTFDERPAGTLEFNKLNDANEIEPQKSVRSTEAKFEVRYAPNEKFFQQKRKRYPIPSERLELKLTHIVALKGVLGGMYDYNKTEFMFQGEKWVAPFGKFDVTLKAAHLWGEATFPILISPSANNSFTIQKGEFALLKPLEFLHDRQLSWDVNYRMGGWLFNRIPLINKLRLREVFGFRGVWGDLSERNDPNINRDLLLFPKGAFTADRDPYMEYNIGIENILSFFRIDYVRRVNYLYHPGVSKHGIRFTVDFTF